MGANVSKENDVPEAITNCFSTKNCYVTHTLFEANYERGLLHVADGPVRANQLQLRRFSEHVAQEVGGSHERYLGGNAAYEEQCAGTDVKQPQWTDAMGGRVVVWRREVAEYFPFFD